MTFEEAFRDMSVKAIRLPIWANVDARLELPAVKDGKREGVWCTLIDPGAREDIREQKVLATEFMGYPGCHYEQYQGSGK